MYCRKCGNVLSDGSKFCGQCGCEVYIPNTSVNYSQVNSYQGMNIVPLASSEVNQTSSIVMEEKNNIPNIELMPIEEINRVSKNGVVLTVVFGTFFLAMIMIFVLAVMNSNII